MADGATAVWQSKMGIIVFGTGLTLAGAVVGYNSHRIDQLTAAINDSPPPLYRSYVESRLNTIENQLRELKEDQRSRFERIERKLDSALMSR